MIPAEISGTGRRCANCPGVAHPDALAAPDTLTDNLDRSFVCHPNGFGRTCADARGMALAQGFIEIDEA